MKPSDWRTVRVSEMTTSMLCSMPQEVEVIASVETPSAEERSQIHTYSRIISLLPPTVVTFRVRHIHMISLRRWQVQLLLAGAIVDGAEVHHDEIRPNDTVFPSLHRATHGDTGPLVPPSPQRSQSLSA